MVVGRQDYAQRYAIIQRILLRSLNSEAEVSGGSKVPRLVRPPPFSVVMYAAAVEVA
jgi:hypothetical protein